MPKNHIHTDIAIVGIGIAGLTTAIYISEKNPQLKILLISKKSIHEGNTILAQGGIAAVTDTTNDSFESHINDTIKAGYYKGNKKVIKEVIQSASKCIKDLINWNIEFDSTDSAFDLHREGGHEQSRVLHHLDSTGKEIHQKLIIKAQLHKNISIIENFTAIDLIVKNNRCNGFYGLNAKDEITVVQSTYVVLATGGSGQLFAYTTNSTISTADGVAMASRAGAKIDDMNYYQFHPTAIFKKEKQQLNLITEALRGFGAQIINSKGERFIFKYDSNGELANRHIITKAIITELKETNKECVFLKVSHLNKEEIINKFPTVIKACLNNGINPFENNIPIIPAAHYQCGGISVDKYSRSSIENLFAIGECAFTGLHGSNRLASNSLLEAIHFAKKTSLFILKNIHLVDISKCDFSPILQQLNNMNQIENFNYLLIRNNLSKMMTELYFITKYDSQFIQIEKQLYLLKKDIKNTNLPLTINSIELSNLLEVGEIFLEARKRMLQQNTTLVNY